MTQRLKTSAVLGLLALSLFSGRRASAEDRSPTLTVAPHTFEYRVEKGQVIEDKIKVLNSSDFPIPLKAKLVDFTAADDTGQMMFESSGQDQRTDPMYWIKIPKPEVLLDKGETEDVKFTLEVPKDADLGGYYAVVILEPQLPSYYFTENQPKVIPAVGAIFLISVEEPGVARTGDPFIISELSIPEKFHLQKLEEAVKTAFGLVSKASAQSDFSIVENSFLDFTFRVKNTDIYHVKPFGKLEIVTMAGKVVGETEIKKTTVLPGKTRKSPVSFTPEISPQIKKYLPAFAVDFITKNFLWGKYRARMTLEVENDATKDGFQPFTAMIVKETEFWAFPWKAMLVILGFLVFVLFLILIRKRLALAVKTVFSRRGVLKTSGK